MATKKSTPGHASPKKRSPTKEQARAWLASVLVPMSAELETTAEYLERGNWSFQEETQDFEFLSPAAKMLAPRFRPNLEQLFRFYPRFKGTAEQHDVALDQLRQACQAAHAQLMKSLNFRHLAPNRTRKDYQKLAEYVVNGVRDPGRDSSLQKLYTSKDFLALRTVPGLKDAFEAVTAAGERYRQRHAELQQAVSGLQTELADGYGLPPIDPVGESVL
jgi:hypothetical protein